MLWTDVSKLYHYKIELKRLLILNTLIYMFCNLSVIRLFVTSNNNNNTNNTHTTQIIVTSFCRPRCYGFINSMLDVYIASLMRGWSSQYHLHVSTMSALNTKRSSTSCFRPDKLVEFGHVSPKFQKDICQQVYVPSWSLESNYSSGTLIHNWSEERRKVRQLQDFIEVLPTLCSLHQRSSETMIISGERNFRK